MPTIRRVTQEDAEAYLDCVASVAAERKYLARVDGFSLDGTNAFIESVVRHGWPMMVAVSNSSIVGWCDIIPRASVGYTHVASLGMGVPVRIKADSSLLAEARSCSEAVAAPFSGNVAATSKDTRGWFLGHLMPSADRLLQR